MKVTIEMNEEYLVDALYSGQRGIRYWGVPQTDEADNLLVAELATGLVFRLDSAALHRGMVAMARVAPSEFAALLRGDGMRVDEQTGDALIQCACFGELRYG